MNLDYFIETLVNLNIFRMGALTFRYQSSLMEVCMKLQN